MGDGQNMKWRTHPEMREQYDDMIAALNNQWHSRPTRHQGNKNVLHWPAHPLCETRGFLIAV